MDLTKDIRNEGITNFLLHCRK